MKPSRQLVRDTLKDWVAWSRDREKDHAEKGYYSISPPWHLVIPIGRTLRLYDEEAAEMVEAVLSEMYKWRPKAWALLRYYYLRDELLSTPGKIVINKKDMSPSVVGDSRGMSEDDFIRWVGIGKRQFYRRLGEALDVYGSFWARMYWDDCKEKMENS